MEETVSATLKTSVRQLDQNKNTFILQFDRFHVHVTFGMDCQENVVATKNIIIYHRLCVMDLHCVKQILHLGKILQWFIL